MRLPDKDGQVGAPRPAEQRSEPDSTLPPGLALRLRLARLSLAWERIWPALWPALGILGIYTVIALSGILATLPLGLHWAVWLLTAATAAAALYRNRHEMTWPTEQQAKRRLEEQNRLTHRPLSSLDDVPAIGADPLWRRHKARQLQSLHQIKAHWPRSGLPARDPMALRALLLILLLVSAVMAGPLAPARLGEALYPGFESRGPQGRLDAWITPPAYTGQAPVYLSQDQLEPISVPTGSRMTVQVQGGGTPYLSRDGVSTPLERTGNADSTPYQSETVLDADTQIALRQSGRDKADWSIAVIPDLPPTAGLSEPITSSLRKSLRIPYEVSDDYGVASLTLRLSLDGFFVLRDNPIFTASGNDHAVAPHEAPLEPEQIDLGLPGRQPLHAARTVYKDLTAHPWAGLNVRLELIAQDAIGQEGAIQPVTMTLPAREFTEPLAAALIEQRQRLAINPATRLSVAGFLDAFTLRPEDYSHDLSVYLGIRAAYWRLHQLTMGEDFSDVSQLLWDIALHIEEGDVSDAERDLRAAREALARALEDGASPEEIEQLMAELRQALSQYLNTLANQQSAQSQPTPPGDGETMERRDLEDMLDAIGDLARTGARDQAQDLLAQLDEILENMEAGETASGMTPGENTLSDAIGEMSDMIQQQQELMDQTFQHGQGSQAGTLPGEGSPDQNPLEGLQQAQEALRQNLENLMGELAENGQQVPGGLEDAVRAMEQAEDRLAQGRADRAAGSQGQAIDELREGAQALADAMFESMAARGDQQGTEEGGDQVDPLGRPLSSQGRNQGEGVRLPDAFDLQRAREILDELRRRAGELGRPQEELDYLDRLLQRF